jgi:hypothetical protein
LLKEVEGNTAVLKWKHHKNAVGSVKSTGGSAENHAERVAYKNLPVGANNVYLVVQDAFPCLDKCTNYFLGLTKSKSTLGIIIKVTADNTFDGNSYVADQYIPNLTSFPYYLFYWKGALTANSNGQAPQGFPAHPTPVPISAP